ncbi:hypothetical protein K466DRAFT_77175 [Polyporus arcularius HHB13444]|uniref:Uncharacterized protein n=1 Tax=Polyporus arcularius HHB13444 TaxID=1314778 RepID=A0A5C3PH22_9APHY|nr:hypothetical protein K466DRAFT_77175 [Polyporus arcularius HHB13444]
MSLPAAASTHRTLFQEAFSLRLPRNDGDFCRYVLAELCIFDTPHHVWFARVSWDVIVVAKRTSCARAAPAPITLQRDGARIQLPADAFTDPVFCTFDRLRDVILPKRILLIIHFNEAADGPALQVEATLEVKTLPPPQFTGTSPYVSLPICTCATGMSAGEDSDDLDEDEILLLQNGFVVDALDTDEDEEEDVDVSDN